METIMAKFGVICRRLMSLGDIKFGENRFSVNHTLFCGEDKNFSHIIVFPILFLDTVCEPKNFIISYFWNQWHFLRVFDKKRLEEEKDIVYKKYLTFSHVFAVGLRYAFYWW